MTKELGTLKRIDLREVWPNEAHDFTPWLAENIESLGEALGVDLELVTQEADVGDFSLDILAKDLGTGKNVVIENQLTTTDHDHLGKLLTYASGYDAEMVVWVSQEFREEHRQTLDWLNQRTDSETFFFAIVVDLLSVDDSRPAPSFRLVVAPNEWQKTRRSISRGTSSREEAYRVFFQKLIDELREQHKFTNAKVGQPQSWYAFSSGLSAVVYAASFTHGNRLRAELYIDQGDATENKRIFDALSSDKSSIEAEYGEPFEWERLDTKRASRIAVYRSGTILSSSDELEEIHKWLVEHLLKLKEVFGPRVRKILEAGSMPQ